MYQQITIVGNVGKDPEFRYTPQGVAVADFSVAVNKRTGKGEDRKDKTTWFRVTVWRERAETVQQYVRKGMKIMVIGEVEARAYTDKAGQPACTLELTASNFQFLDSKNDNAGGGGQVSAGYDADGKKSDDDESSDIPF